MATSHGLAAVAASFLNRCRHTLAERSGTSLRGGCFGSWVALLEGQPWITNVTSARLHSIPFQREGLSKRVKELTKELASELNLSKEQLSELEALKGRSALLHAQHLLGQAPQAAQQKFHQLVSKAMPASAYELLPFTIHMVSGLVESQILEQLQKLTPQQIRALPDFDSLAAEATAAGAEPAEVEEAVKKLMIESIQFSSWEELLPIAQCWPAIQQLAAAFPALEGPLGLLGVKLETVKEEVEAQEILDKLRSGVHETTSTSPSSFHSLASQCLWQEVQQHLIEHSNPDVTLIRRILSLPTYPPALPQATSLLTAYQAALQELEKHWSEGSIEGNVSAAAGDASAETSVDTATSNESNSSRSSSVLDVDRVKALVQELRARQDDNAVASFFAELGQLRRMALMEGPCQLLLSVASDELKQIPDTLFKAIRRRIFTMQESGRHLSRQLLEGSISLQQLRALSQEQKEGLVWCLVMESSVEQGRDVLCALLRQHVLSEEWRCLHEFDMAKRAVETHLLEEVMVVSHPATGLRGDYKPRPKLSHNRFLDMLRSSGVPESMVTRVGDRGIPSALTPDWLVPDAEMNGVELNLDALPPAQRKAAQVLGSCPVVGSVFVPTHGSPEFAEYQQQALAHLAQASIDWEQSREQRTFLVRGSSQGSMRLHLGYPAWIAAATNAVTNLPEAAKQLLTSFTESRLEHRGLVRKRGKAREAHKKLADLHQYLSQEFERRADVEEPTEVAVVAQESLQSDYNAVVERQQEEEMGPLRHMVQVLLGENEARKFSEWYMSQQRSSRRSRMQGPPEEVESFEILQKLHMAMDEERYVRMQFEPEMHLDLDSAVRMEPSSSATFGREEADGFLDSFQAFLNKYLEASGHAPVEGSEWKVYKTASLWDLHPLREAGHLHQLQQGESGWFDAKRDSEYLRSLMWSLIPSTHPLYAAGLKYLAVVDANPSWKFAHKRHMVMRLAELAKKLHVGSGEDAGLQSPLALVLGEENVALEIGLSKDPRLGLVAATPPHAAATSRTQPAVAAKARKSK